MKSVETICCGGRWVKKPISLYLALLIAALVCAADVRLAWSSEGVNDLKTRPWMDTHLSPDERADLLVREMTLDEKIQLIHGSDAMNNQIPGALGGDGFVPGIPRLGIPALQLVGASVGVTNQAGRNTGHATALPSTVAETATWDPALARDYGAVIGRELRNQGFNGQYRSQEGT